MLESKCPCCGRYLVFHPQLVNLSFNCPGCGSFLFWSARTGIRGTYSNPIWETRMPSNFATAMQDIANQDVQTLIRKDAEYGSSWKKRGGVGAFMMLARKWDRLETQCTRKELDSKYDIFDAIEQDNAHPPGHAFFESTLETIRDLRRYLLLVESEIVLRNQVNRGGTPPQPLVKAGDFIPNVGKVLPADKAFPADDEYAHPLQQEPRR